MLLTRRFIVLATCLCLAGLTACEDAEPALQLISDDTARSEPRIDIPDQFPLQARTVDQDGAPLAGVRITVNGADLGITSTATGLFVWPEPVHADDAVLMEHPDFVSSTKSAGTLWFHEDAAIYIQMSRYTESFDVTAAGGFFRGDQIILDVPEGAVTEPVTIRAALLPIADTYADSDAIQAVRLTAIALDPDGQEFLKPITVSVPLENPGAAEGVQDVFLSDPATGLYQRAPSASVEVDGSRAIFTLPHFSGYAAGDPSEGLSKRRMERTNDYDGDGRITSQDALLVVILSGGTHSASLTRDTSIGSTIMRSKSSGSGSSSSEGSSASGGASFGGISVEVESSVDATEAEEVMNSFGRSEGISVREGFEISLSAGEYDVRCRYFVGIYDYWRVRTWEEVEPNPGERRGLEEAYEDQESHPDDGYEHYRIGPGGTSMVVGRVLFAGDRVAVRKDGDSYKYFRLKDEYMVRTPVSIMPVNCDPGPLPAGNVCPPPSPSVELPIKGGDTLDEANFTPTAGGGYSSSRYGGWGILPSTTPTPIRGMECGNELSGFITITNTTSTMSETERSRISSESSAISGSVSASVPLPGGLGIEAGAGASSESSLSESQSLSRGRATTITKTTEIRWTVHNAHEVHISDHALYRLHNIETSRTWAPVAADDVPEGLQSGVSGSPGFGSAGDDLYMRDADGSWFKSSPPTTTEKDIGFALIRLTECGCGDDEPVMTRPRTTAPQVEDEDAVAPAPSPAQTAPPPTQTAPPPQPRVITPGPGEYVPPSERDPGGQVNQTTQPDQTSQPDPTGQVDQTASAPEDVAVSRQQSSEQVTVRFTAIEGRTVLNRDYIGEIQSVSFVALDGSSRPPDAAAAETVEDQGDRIDINLPDASDIARVVVSGLAGTVVIERASSAGAPPGIIWPLDGMVDIIAGQLNETLLVPADVFDLETPPSDYLATVAGSQTDIVAIRSGEVGMRSGDVNLDPAGTDIVISSPDGQSTVSGEVPAWGYRLSLGQEIVDVNQTVPVYAQAIGLAADEELVLEFLPLPTQTIEPRTVVLTAGQADAPIPVADLQTEQIGPQMFNAQVTIRQLRQGSPD